MLSVHGSVPQNLLPVLVYRAGSVVGTVEKAPGVSVSLNGSGSVVGSLPFFTWLGAGRPWAGAGFRVQFRMPVAHSLEHARTGHIFILSIHKVIG